eukprot:scaffold422880_cov20-Prasinocladus_malaysianus.AAC.1
MVFTFSLFRLFLEVLNCHDLIAGEADGFSALQAAVAGPPGRYPHQEELLRMIHGHLSRDNSSQ